MCLLFTHTTKLNIFNIYTHRCSLFIVCLSLSIWFGMRLFIIFTEFSLMLLIKIDTCVRILLLFLLFLRNLCYAYQAFHIPSHLYSRYTIIFLLLKIPFISHIQLYAQFLSHFEDHLKIYLPFASVNFYRFSSSSPFFFFKI